MKLLALAGLVVFALTFATPATAGPLEDAESALERGDYVDALRSMRPLAEHGNVGAQYGLGLMYSHGYGVRQDYAEAVRWFRKAAEQGNTKAQYNLGVMYAQGQGVPKDYVQAHRWLNLAAARFPASENEQRDNAVKNRDRIAAKMTPAQIAEAQKLAREWKPTLTPPR